MKEIIIIMALAIAFLSVAFVLVSALRGDKKQNLKLELAAQNEF